MTTRGFISVCLKLVAVYYLVQTIAGLATASFFQAFNQSSQLGGVYPIVTVGLPGLMSLALFWLIRKSDLLASKLVREDSLRVSVHRERPDHSIVNTKITPS